MSDEEVSEQVVVLDAAFQLHQEEAGKERGQVSMNETAGVSTRVWT